MKQEVVQEEGIISREQTDTSKINRLMIHTAVKFCWKVRDKYAFMRFRMLFSNTCKEENTVSMYPVTYLRVCRTCLPNAHWDVCPLLLFPFPQPNHREKRQWRWFIWPVSPHSFNHVCPLFLMFGKKKCPLSKKKSLECHGIPSCGFPALSKLELILISKGTRVDSGNTDHLPIWNQLPPPPYGKNRQLIMAKSTAYHPLKLR
ncbi:uncharacterized protein LOC106510102 [Sus scrofa]|uniref:uncharacterized protein LOC106510102 n=1 Tax=Sus scrofa TaxID=9823 RepID=UPI000A2B4A0B|nr:uncharacterized protein LOC106510102 [Sus scrofa]